MEVELSKREAGDITKSAGRRLGDILSFCGQPAASWWMDNGFCFQLNQNTCSYRSIGSETSNYDRLTDVMAHREVSLAIKVSGVGTQTR